MSKGKHSAGDAARPTVFSIRRRLLMEQHLPPGVNATISNMLRYYGTRI